MTKLKVPKGWRALRRDSEIKDGDKFTSRRLPYWMDSSGSGNGKVGKTGFRYIRRIKNRPDRHREQAPNP